MPVSIPVLLSKSMIPFTIDVKESIMYCAADLTDASMAGRAFLKELRAFVMSPVRCSRM